MELKERVKKDFDWDISEALKEKTIGDMIYRLLKAKYPYDFMYYNDEYQKGYTQLTNDLFIETIKEVLSSRDISQEEKNSALRYTVFNDNFTCEPPSIYCRIAELLIESGADVNHSYNPNPDDYKSKGYHQTMLGAQYLKYSQAKFLLEHGASLKIPSSKGLYPVFDAARRSQIEVIELMHSFDPTITTQTDKKGETALFWYPVGDQSYYYLNEIDTLKKLGFDINHKNNEGRTCLNDLASADCKLPYITDYLNKLDMILKTGVDASIPDNYGMTATDYVNRSIDNCVSALQTLGNGLTSKMSPNTQKKENNETTSTTPKKTNGKE